MYIYNIYIKASENDDRSLVERRSDSPCRRNKKLFPSARKEKTEGEKKCLIKLVKGTIYRPRRLP